MTPIQKTAIVNIVRSFALGIGGAIVVVCTLRFIAITLQEFGFTASDSLGIICISCLLGLLAKIAYDSEVSRLEALDRLNRKD
mgnify:CR=1 FL=1